MIKRSSLDEFNEIVLIWKHEQKNLIGNKLRSVLIQKGLLNDAIQEIIKRYVNEELDEKLIT